MFYNLYPASDKDIQVKTIWLVVHVARIVGI